MATTPPGSMNGVALVTGAASGIGRAVAHTFIREGCTRIVLADLDEASLQAVAKELESLNRNVRALAIKTDIASEPEVHRLIDTAVREFGAIHYAVNNAGVTSNPRVRTHELNPEAWDKVVSVNLRGTWLCQRAELAQMVLQNPELQARADVPPQRGAIVNVSSLFAILSHPTVGAYSASKAGILGLSRTDAIAYGQDGIRINSVLPGFVKTPMVEESIRRGANYESSISSVPMRRWGDPVEIAEAVVFLASEKASLINGTELTVDGGKQYAV
ncbi:hypothetical protein FE257_008063 [Aspergillus nanangensis]|uniref:Uncharacterized protein n=1 Tax=Aspergillus nanangensis TaxID=2582783 RepID=A0AAD4CM98_ASPNN|nr:hypothetical protein FE257_008063 [Aspergillus nanangensis]